MISAIPLYIEERRTPGSPGEGSTSGSAQRSGEPGERPVFVVRPLFADAPVRQSDLLSRAVTRVTQDIRLLLMELGRADRHDALARWTWAPDLTAQMLDVPLDLRREDARVRLLVALYPFAGRWVAFSPSVPGVVFDVSRKAALFDRAREVYTAHFRAVEKAGGARPAVSRAWLSWAEVTVTPERAPASAGDERRVAVTRLEKLSGELELLRTGTCLTWEDPDALPPATGRGPEVDALEQLLTQRIRRPVLLLGPRAAGKTAVVHELVRRSAGRPAAGARTIWHLSPQRLIAGMSFVGQWEQRVLAILDTAARKDLVLYFDDVLGLYAAGISSSSDLSVAHVLRTRIDQRRVRVLAEMTPEAFRLLKEKDRGLADLFHVVPVRETGPTETLAIAIGLIRDLEGRHRCTFEADALPAVLDLTARHARDLAFPGKAASLLRELAVKFAGGSIGRDTVLRDLSARSGLSVAFLDGRALTERATVHRALAERVVGQPAAVDALTDVVVTARARLADPGRPLASLLFLGPTGVGKTECARALAHHLFGDAKAMIRLDMNEFVAPGSAARLVGTFHEPEGLLTAAVRRQPCSIVLLDEIEKADADVLDLLLQVLGDGRLTDGRGRTTDFSQVFVVMTSNLGAREAGAELGFGETRQSAEHVYRRAAQHFFRPELYNRFDRVVPFTPLSRAHVETIARTLIDGVLERGGLKQRRCQLMVDPSAMESIVDAGFHPELGARALKRAVETQLAQPVAERLAALPPGTPALLRLERSDAGLAVMLDALVPRVRAVRPPLTGKSSDILRSFEERISALEPRVAELAPAEIAAGDVRPEHLRYFALDAQLRRASTLREHLARRAAARGPQASKLPARQPGRRLDVPDPTALWRELLAAEDPVGALKALTSAAARHGESLADRLEELDGEIALAERMIDSALRGTGTRTVLDVSPVGAGSRPLALALASHYQQLFTRWDGFHATPAEDWRSSAHFSATVEGPAAAALCAIEHGTHVFWDEGRPQGLVRVSAGASGDLPPVVRMYTLRDLSVDVDTGLILPFAPDASDLRQLLTLRLAREVPE